MTRALIYNASTNSFGPSNRVTNAYLQNASGAVNRNGSLLATRVSATSLETSNFGPIQSLSSLVGGVAFDATKDIVYGVSSYLSQIIAYDTNTLAERFRFDIGETVNPYATQFGSGLLVASQDGHYLALRTDNSVHVYELPAARLLGVASEMNHGGATLGVTLPLDGPRAIESRSGGVDGTYTMVFTFERNLSSVGGASVTGGSATVAGSMIDSGDSRRYLVTLKDVASGQTIKVTLSNVTDVLGYHTALISQQMGVLIGDANSDGTVNSGDATIVRNSSGQLANATSFRSDVNLDGVINSGDATIVRARSGQSLGSVATAAPGIPLRTEANRGRN